MSKRSSDPDRLPVAKRLKTDNPLVQASVDDGKPHQETNSPSWKPKTDLSAEKLDELWDSSLQRFRRFGKLEDIQKAVEYSSWALELTPTNYPDLARRLGNSGESLYDRFQRLGELDDIQKAIKYETRALDLTPTDHPDIPRRLASLGSSHYDRFQRLGELDDIQKAIEYNARALDLTPNDHPNLPLVHYNIANTQFTQFQRTGDLSILQDSLVYFRKSSKSSIGSPRHLFGHAVRWAALASQHTALSVIEAYQTAIDLLPQFIWLGATINQRYQDLSTSSGLAINAAHAAITALYFHLALKWLEDARCVVWNQSLMLRTPLDRLYSSNSALANRLQLVANQLHTTSSEFTISQDAAPGLATPEQYADRRRRLAREYHDLLAQARDVPGFEGFLRPTNADVLITAARNGPVVVLNCHADHSDALIVLPGQQNIGHLRLQNCSQKEIREACSAITASLRSKGIRERGFKTKQHSAHGDRMQSVLLNLWNNIVKPVLDFLGYTDNHPTASLPHITWCPTGPMTFLPLHAAGDYDQPGSRVFDYAISSYTPTLTALLSSTPSLLTRTSRMLAIGQAITPGRSPLPGTSLELEHVRAHMQDRAEWSQLIDDQATTATVLNGMEQHDWVHLACHAHQNVQDPTKSGFFLHDGTLDLASINRRSFKNKGLAFLSACQTATGDQLLPDESVHLASGMLMAGYASVIGTMWSVSDSDAPFVADKVYAELMKDGKVGNGEAGRALHHGISALREVVGEKNFGRWVPYIHIGS